MSARRRTPSKFAWRTHPTGIFAKILLWLVAQQAAEASGCRIVKVPRNLLWDEVVTRMPYLPTVWADATGHPLTPGVLWNRLYYFYKTHQPGGGRGPLVDGVSPEHPTRSARLKPYVAGVRAVFEHHEGRIPRELAEWVCSDPAPTADDVLAKRRAALGATARHEQLCSASRIASSLLETSPSVARHVLPKGWHKEWRSDKPAQK